MAKEISVENVCQFITDHGGKVKNTVLVSNFKKILNDPATKDEARQKFKECVNIVAVVKTENGEKYVQLKKKYRTSAVQSESPTTNLPANTSLDVSHDSSSGHDTSFTPAADVPYADGGKHEKSPSKASSQTSPEKSKHSRSSSSTSNEKQKSASSPRHQSSHKEGQSVKEVSEHKSTSESHRDQPPKSSSKHEGVQAQKKVEVPAFDHEAQKEQQQRKGKQTSPDVGMKKETASEVKPTPVSSSQTASDAKFAVPTSAPMRKKKERKENVPPSPKLEHVPLVTSVDRLKSNLQNSPDQRSSRSRPISMAQGSYAGSVERARQNFLNKQKTNDDEASIALSERSLDSKGDEQDDEYDRNLPSVSLDINEKEWIIRSAQGNLVEMRKLLNTDSALADKRDFIMGYSALHWAAKKGNPDMVNMLIDQKVNINCKSNGGYTPLHIAAMHGHEDIITLLLDAGCDSNVRDYSGHQAIHYLKSVSLPLQSKLRYEPNTPSWKHHYHAGTKHKPLVRKEVYNRLERSMRGRRGSKVPSESGRVVYGEGEPIEGRHRVNSAGSTDRKNSTGNGGSKTGKVSRAESMLKGIGIRRKTSFRKSKNSGGIPEEPIKIEHPVPPPAPTNKPPPSVGVMMWKPVGPKV